MKVSKHENGKIRETGQSGKHDERMEPAMPVARKAYGQGHRGEAHSLQLKIHSHFLVLLAHQKPTQSVLHLCSWACTKALHT